MQVEHTHTHTHTKLDPACVLKAKHGCVFRQLTLKSTQWNFSIHLRWVFVFQISNPVCVTPSSPRPREGRYDEAIKEVVTDPPQCPSCGVPFKREHALPINGSPEQVDRLRAEAEERHRVEDEAGAAKEKKKEERRKRKREGEGEGASGGGAAPWASPGAASTID